MRINAKRSACIRFGPRYDVDFFQLFTANRDIIEWVDYIRYLGVYFVSDRYFKCNWDHAKSSYAIFGRIGRFASVESYVFHQKQMYTCPYL